MSANSREPDRLRTPPRPREGPTAPGPAPASAEAFPYQAVIFDLDEVVADTAALHAMAWKRLFDDVWSDPRAGAMTGKDRFDPDTDYRRYVDGRAREDGAAAFLAARGVQVPLGVVGDTAQSWTVHGLAERKNALYIDLLPERGLRVFDGTVALLRRLRRGGVVTGLVTASSNAERLLEAADLKQLFNVVVDGGLAGDLRLAGKPDPAMFLEAARRLGVAPARAAAVADSVAGVQAAHGGGFALVVGIDRTGHREALESAGADLVLQDVDHLDLGVLRVDPWLLAYEGFDPAHEGHREALTTLGNGYLGTRGAAPERHADGVHYPGTYLAGVYNRLTSEVQGRQIEDEHLVNAPNWLLLDLKVGGAPWWSEAGLTIQQERRELDLRAGVLTRCALLTDPSGRALRLTQRRLVSMDRPHLAALETTLVAEGWSGRVTVRSGVDAGVTNDNVAEYRGLANRHLTAVTLEQASADTVIVIAETSQSRIRIATAVRTTVTGTRGEGERIIESADGWHAQRFDVELEDGCPVLIDKSVAVVTSRDPAISSPELGALDQLSRGPAGFQGLLPDHMAAWAGLWDQCGIVLESEDRQSQSVLNLHVFHLLQAVSAHTAGLDAGVPARGLHGEGYRGHVFWDELFVLPVVTAHMPVVTRSLLDYRWRRLDAAREAARGAGLTGALFPWQSGSDGREETPSQLFNLRSGRWMPDHSRRQRHVGLAVAFDAWAYYQATGDRVWLAERGAELIIEVARLFAALANYDPTEDRFHIAGVMGPDEYHDGYPDAPGEGLRDNTYTNVLAAWLFGRAGQTLTLLAGHECERLIQRLGVDPQEPLLWGHLSRRLAVPFHEGGVLSQFDGYEDLAELDWGSYRATYGNIGRLDLILEAEGDATNRYRLAKQADVLMLIYLLGPDRLIAVLGQLGYPVSHEVVADTVEFYLARTAHGSTLSRVVHASVLARFDPSRAWTVFRDALTADLDDTQGGTTEEGVHLGAMAGTIDLVTRAFAGVQTHADTLSFAPRLPDELHRAQFQVQYRGHRIDVTVDHARLHLASHRCAGVQDVNVDVAGTHAVLGGGQELEFESGTRR